MRDLDLQLMDAVTYRRVEEVKQLLDQGANPNFYYDKFDYDLEAQPTTPLRAVVFSISDALLTDKDLEQFIPIVKMLLEYGADPEPAKNLSNKRYGLFKLSDRTDAFYKVLELIFAYEQSH